MKKNVRNLRINYSKFMWLTSLAIFFVLAISPFKLNAQSTKANFAGTWAINATKSNQGDGNSRAARQLTVKQEGNNLTVDRLRANRDGVESIATDKFTLDGKEIVNTSNRGTSKSVATWSADGKTLTIATTRSFDRNGTVTEMKSYETWSRTDATTLTIISISPSQNGERKVSLVYDQILTK